MPKNTLFKAYDLRRKNLHTIGSPPIKIDQHRVEKRDWADRQKQGTRKGLKRKAAKQTVRLVPTAASILREDGFDTECLHCGKQGDDPTCDGAKCYRDFVRENFPADFIDIRGPGALGYAAYTKPGVSLKKGQWLGEYLGDLRPFDDFNSESMYCFHIPNKCVLDAEKAGNWTRFINSNCRPNVQAVPEFVGKRSVLIFRAKKDIGPEEELTFNYGKAYFKNAGFPCACSVCAPARRKQKGSAGVDPAELRRIIDAL